MSKDDERQKPGTVDGDNAQIAESGGDVLLDRIREARENINPRDKHLVLMVPGYEEYLAVRYRYIDGYQTEDMAKQLRKVKTGQMLIGSIDTLIEACDMILVRDPGHPSCIHDDGGELTEYRPIIADAVPPVRFEQRLADTLKFEASDARAVVNGVFQNDHAIVQQNIKVSRWMADVTREVDDDFLGE